MENTTPVTKFVPPRWVPSRESKYMGEAWFKASFSKDPSTQVGAVIIGKDNMPLGSGYNGPPNLIGDNDFSWERPSRDNPDAFSKYDVVVHAEINAIDHSNTNDFEGATLYVTALPCPDCMLEIIRKKIFRVVYFDFQSSQNSSLQNASWREKSFRLAKMGRVNLEKFSGDLGWMLDWNKKLQGLGVFG